MTKRTAIRAELFGVELDGRRTGHVFMDEVGVRDEWERQEVVAAPGTMLFLTPRTEHLPYEPPDGWDGEPGVG